jgi:hypothetical protein
MAITARLGITVNASARGRTGTSALYASSDIAGLSPVAGHLRAARSGCVLPALVAAEPYGTPHASLLDRDVAEDAAAKLQQARHPAHALILNMSLDGPACRRSRPCCSVSLRPHTRTYLRASLDATREADELLRDALGAKTEELRRLRHRLAEQGAVRFEVARSWDVAAALETFLQLSEWLEGPARHCAGVIAATQPCRRATMASADSGQCEIAVTRRRHLAAAIVVASASRSISSSASTSALRNIRRRAVDARTDPASLRRSRDRLGRLHRKPRSSDDRSNLARSVCDRRRADPAAEE